MCILTHSLTLLHLHDGTLSTLAILAIARAARVARTHLHHPPNHHPLPRYQSNSHHNLDDHSHLQIQMRHLGPNQIPRGVFPIDKKRDIISAWFNPESLA